MTESPDFLIDQLLEKQKDLNYSSTAVEEFSNHHSNDAIPSQAKHYEKLIPMNKPKEGEQYSFEVDLDNCTGCKACVTGCHNLNGLDDEETWRDVGVLHNADHSTQEPFIQTVTTACHHCVEPACMEGCPVNAYDKHDVTGIVKHLDDQCIGCQYCVLKCPYDVPKYNKDKGIVRKCDMCSDRLAVGEAPACVQSCPNEAISIKIVNKEEILKKNKTDDFLPDTPNPEYTNPTTNYVSKKKLPSNLVGGDFYSLHPEHSHMPLVIMLILTQLSVGALGADWVFNSLFALPATQHLQSVFATFALIMAFVALGAATFHLGRPLYAWRAFIGIRTSWMSREIIVFGGFAKLAIAYAASFAKDFILAQTGLSLPSIIEENFAMLQLSLGGLVVFTGLFGVFCSVKIYTDTQKDFWKPSITIPKFFGTTAILGLSFIGLLAVISTNFLSETSATDLYFNALNSFSWILAILGLLKLAFEASFFKHLKSEKFSAFKRSALLMRNQLKMYTSIRFLTGLFGCFMAIAPALTSVFAPTALNNSLVIFCYATSFLCLITGELLERFLYFTAVAAKKMPGGFK